MGTLFLPGYDPKLELFVKNGKMTVKGAVTETFETDDPASVIRKVLHEYHSGNPGHANIYRRACRILRL